ncbi:hypothetical protein [Pseudanabaena sp. FACHB-2040]|uniref:hypothetical protein n=1 Tax=Pseudanabaena sp. FACHB-2040 TaxID=2692859 RepID=UPI0016891B80|nr:hypothetical protein [Pseudanabaena sp. FACHB-2040]MBD2257123.1 hypothetical protein [Pseudanabaena sp. FACHB-2040]
MPDDNQDKLLENIDLDPDPEEGETPIDEMSRKTGQQAMEEDVRPGAEAEAPGHKNDVVPGNPNQGTDAR